MTLDFHLLQNPEEMEEHLEVKRKEKEPELKTNQVIF